MTEMVLNLDQPPRALSPAVRFAMAALVVVAHAGVGWMVWRQAQTPADAPPPKVLEVSWISPAQPDNTPPPQAEPTPPQPTPPQPPARTVAPALAPAPALIPAPSPVSPAPAVALAPVAIQQPVAPAAKGEATSAAEVAAAPAPAAPKLIASSALRYLDPLKPVYPRVSTDLCETGVVTLNILVNEWGVPVEVVVEKSSGHDRLDQSALNAMRAARFKPYTEAGQARSIRAHPTINFQLDC